MPTIIDELNKNDKTQLKMFRVKLFLSFYYVIDF